MTGPDDFWAGYAETLARVRVERPSTVDEVAAILNDFQPRSAGVAFFGNNADDRLSDALADAGWELRFLEQDYLWQAQHPDSGERLHYVEGDVYPGPWAEPRYETAESASPSLATAGRLDGAPDRDVSPPELENRPDFPEAPATDQVRSRGAADPDSVTTRAASGPPARVSSTDFGAVQKPTGAPAAEQPASPPPAAKSRAPESTPPRPSHRGPRR